MQHKCWGKNKDRNRYEATRADNQASGNAEDNAPQTTASEAQDKGVAVRPDVPPASTSTIDPKKSSVNNRICMLVHSHTGGSTEEIEKLIDKVIEEANDLLDRGSPLTQLHHLSANHTYKSILQYLAPDTQDPWVEITPGHKGEKIRAVTLCGCHWAKMWGSVVVS
ncbi:hypothetical protein BDV93DRAFT_510907 [Ceratobasidium sp. AG-I]|nr:hypothetical protein BDV93DRAFT_510907 [Ceratobasidium sp. AG-I]